MNAAVGLMDGLGLDGDRCIRVIPRQCHTGKNSLKEAGIEGLNFFASLS